MMKVSLKNISWVFVLLFAVSFFLPALIETSDDWIYGWECAWFVIGRLVEAISDGDSIWLPLLWNMTNLMVLLAFFFHSQMWLALKFLILIVVLCSSGYWVLESFSSDLSIGYYLWFISSAGLIITYIVRDLKQSNS